MVEQHRDLWQCRLVAHHLQLVCQSGRLYPFYYPCLITVYTALLDGPPGICRQQLLAVQRYLVHNHLQQMPQSAAYRGLNSLLQR